MSGTVTVDIPYESLDPLTIGSCDDPSSVYREQLVLRIPRRNLWAWLKPNEPPALPDVTAAAAAALERPVGGPRFSELIGPDRSLSIIIDNQFRPTPASKILPAVFDAVERRRVRDARVICANGKVFPMSERDTELKLGRGNLDRMQRLGIPFFQNDDPRNADLYTFKGVSSRGTPVWVHDEVARCDVRIAIGQTQSNHWGYGGGGKLILPGGVLRRDHRVQPRRLRAVASNPLRRDGRTDADRHRRGRHDVRSHLHPQLGARHQGGGMPPQLRCPSPRPPRGGARVQQDLCLPPPARRPRRHRDLRGVRTDRPPFLPHRMGVHVRRSDPEGRRRHDLLHAEPGGRYHASRPLPGARPVRLHEAVHAAVPAQPRTVAPRHPPSPGSRCGRAASGRRSTRSCPASVSPS